VHAALLTRRPASVSKKDVHARWRVVQNHETGEEMNLNDGMTVRVVGRAGDLDLDDVAPGDAAEVRQTAVGDVCTPLQCRPAP
jgi:hypothetical protein